MASPLTQWHGTQKDVERSNRRTAPLSLRIKCADRAFTSDIALAYALSRKILTATDRGFTNKRWHNEQPHLQFTSANTIQITSIVLTKEIS